MNTCGRVTKSVGDWSDAELLRVGTSGAFATLYGRYERRVYALTRRVCGHRHAEAAVQETFVSVWRCRTDFDAGRGDVAPWLLGIARMRAFDQLRAHGRHDRWVSEDGSADVLRIASADCVEDHVLASIDAASVRGLLDGLVPAQREVLELAYFEGLSHREIATRLGLPLGTVKGRMRLALDRLRGRMPVEPAPLALAA